MLAFERGDNGDREFWHAGADRNDSQPDNQVRYAEMPGNFNGSPDQELGAGEQNRKA